MSEATKWTSQGNYVSVKVHRSEVRNNEDATLENGLRNVAEPGCHNAQCWPRE